jgi:hypothetical protein
MSNSDSSTQWILVIVLVGVVGVVVCAGLVAAVYWVMPVSTPPTVTRMPSTPTAVPTLSVEQTEQERQAFARAWRAPRGTVMNAADAETARLLPAEFGGWTVASRGDGVKVPELALDRAGVHAVYESEWRRVDISVCNVSENEEQGVMRAAVEAAQAVSYAAPDARGINYGFLDYMGLTYGAPSRHAWLWWSQGWLFVFVTEDNSIDLESFQRAYLTQVQPPPLSPIEEL